MYDWIVKKSIVKEDKEPIYIYIYIQRKRYIIFLFDIAN
jgi:hypothetical protein